MRGTHIWWLGLLVLAALHMGCGSGGSIGDDDAADDDAADDDTADDDDADDDTATDDDADDDTATDDDTAADDDTEESQTWYEDNDVDGWGNDAVTLEQAGQPDGYVDQGGDCDDNDFTVNPGAVEHCDLKDNDCDGAVDSAVACGCEMADHGGHLYLLCHAATAAWEDARTYCTDRGYDLSTVNDETEGQWLFDQLDTQLPDTFSDGDPHWWIGLNDIAAGGMWEWANGEFVVWNGWGDGEPEDEPGYEEDCVVLIQDASLGWADHDCDEVNEFICESP